MSTIDSQSIINNAIQSLGNWDILVMKKFPSKYILNLEGSYEIFDKSIYENGKINLTKIDATTLFMTILSNRGTKGIISYESFIKFSNLVRDISSINLNITILENNLLLRYENPTTESIPDFDSTELQGEKKNSEFALYYSFCSHDDGKEFVEYINPDIEIEKCITITPLIKASKATIDYSSSISSKQLSYDDDTLLHAMEELFTTGKLSTHSYQVDKREIADHPEFSVFQSAAKLYGISVQLSESDETVNNGYRPEIEQILKDTWGFPSFKQLDIYKNLYQGTEVAKVSQGDVIETILQQAENAMNQSTESAMKNVLLTAPTGAGKSILFQLPAIYLANKYKALTIVVSPLIALMRDQVNNLKGKFDGVASLNGDISAAEKDSIREKVLNGEISILYLAPELLLSYSITTFIGSRRIGLFIVDEAHTVTTWGRDFRVDYWFLGDYLRTAKRILGYSFPIFALTATAVWDPSGKNDMVYETIKSLNMDPCIKYIGVVKRNNIVFDIKLHDIPKKYEEKKRELTVNAICNVIKNKQKAIVYFPYVRTANTLMREPKIVEQGEKVVLFHSRLPSQTKNANALDFKSGKSPVMCATKAFGMGVDVSDINVVYHYAPTGSLSDYVQEIGRLARDPKITGTAKIDFASNDFKYSRVLHGLSAIKPFQLKAVLKKLMSIYHYKGEKRNMLISADDFAYIFAGNDVDYDQKLKSCLLLLSNDLLNKYGFRSIIVRPKSMFTKSFLRFKTKNDALRFNNRFSGYATMTHDERVVMLDSDTYWEKFYSNISFPSFKYKMANGEIFKDFESEVVVKVDITLNDERLEVTKKKMGQFFTLSHTFLDKMATSRHRLAVSDMMDSLPKTMSAEDKESFLETFKNLYSIEGREEPFCSIYRTENGTKESFQLNKSGYNVLESKAHAAFKRYFEDKQENEISVFCAKDANPVFLAELLNGLNLATYQKAGGNEPAIFVRINNPLRLNDIVRRGDYENDMLKNIYERFDYSERVFTYFFRTKMTDSERWDFIEKYFLGASEEELLK